MAFGLLLAAIGLGLGAIGTGVQVAGSMKQAAFSERAEKLRKKQMNLDAERQKRQIIREATMARATALAGATATGSAEGSGLQGALGQITADAGQETQYTEASRGIGSQIFDANAGAARAGGRIAFGSGVSSFGGMLMNNSQTINRLTQYYGQRP